MCKSSRRFPGSLLDMFFVIFHDTEAEQGVSNKHDFNQGPYKPSKGYEVVTLVICEQAAL